MYAFVNNKSDKFDWTYLFQKENMNNLGLGRLAEKFTQRSENYHQKLDDIQKELDGQIN
jgi:hypothetical protein